jgi:GTP-binding protein
VTARFVLSAASERDFPRTGIPEIALVGRSNVGKSSLINALTKKTVARTSAAPGKTTLANYYLVEHPPARAAFYLVDLPGYGFARGGSASAAAFEQLTRHYFQPSDPGPRRLNGVLHLVDSRHPDLPSDAVAHAWLVRFDVPVVVVASKIDKLKRADRARVIEGLGRKYDARVVATSVDHGDGLQELWAVIRTWLTAKDSR